MPTPSESIAEAVAQAADSIGLPGPVASNLKPALVGGTEKALEATIHAWVRADDAAAKHAEQSDDPEGVQ